MLRMRKLLFSTANSEKFELADSVCRKFDIVLEKVSLQIDEIQSEDPERVIRAKAEDAFELCNAPVIVSDDSWSFLGLKGFPGVYMHSINSWFSPEDFIHLTATLTDKRAVLTQHLLYINKNQEKMFTHDLSGILLSSPQGVSEHPSHSVVALDEDHGLSIAEAFSASKAKHAHVAGLIWHDFAEWFIGPEAA